MLSFINILLLTSSLIVITIGKQYPEKWERCKISYSNEIKRDKCIEKTMESVMSNLFDRGDETLGLGTLDPFKINHMVIGQDKENSPVKLIMDFKNMDMKGLKNARVNRALIKLSPPTDWYMKYEFKVPLITMMSNYSVKGNILIFPIVGNGESYISFENVHAVSDLYGNFVTKEGAEYLKISNHTLALSITKFHINLENLFNGNKALGDNMNKVLNENWEILYQELRPSMEKGLDRHFSKYSRKILETIPYKELFIIQSP